YRCLTENALTVYAGYRAPAGVAPPPDATRETEAKALVDGYDAGMLPLDEAYFQTPKSERNDASPRLLAPMREGYESYWRREDDYWAPCSFGSPSDHSPSRQVRRFVVPRRAGGLYVITQKPQNGRSAHVVEFFQDGPRITDQDIDWGAGLLLITG